LRELIAEHSLVTVTGPGGVGKTRLAVAAAESAAPRLAGGVVFVDLVPATPELVPQTVATALGVADRTGQPVENVIVDQLNGMQCLLVLDNCEHVIDAVGELAALLIERSDVTVLATSRERLRVHGERVLLLPPLSLAGPGADPAEGSEAAELFVERVRASGLEVDAEPELVGQVCAKLDGVPLAIELAAARYASLGMDGLLAGLDDRLAFLAGGRGGSERHRSVRAVLDWGHDLLDDAERTLFRRVSVFVGGFDLAAAAAVNHGAAGVSGVIDVIGRLTDKSLLVHERGPAGSRWRMLEVVRGYAREHLAASGDEPDVLAEHLRWAAETAADLDRKLDSGGQWRDVFDAVADDMRVALFGPARDPRGLRPDLALALARLHARRGRFTAAQSSYEAAVSLATSAGDARQLARAALGASTAGMLFGVTQSGRVALLEAALSGQPDEPTGERARLLARLSTELFWSQDRRRSLALADEAVATAERLTDDPGALAHALHARHYVTRAPSGLEERLDLAARVIELARRAGETQLKLAGRAAYVAGLLEAGDLPRMDAELAALAEGADRLNHPEFQWYASVYHLVRALIDGRFDDADRLLEQAKTAAQQAPEFSVGLFFAEAITDLRPLPAGARTARLAQAAEMARRYPGVVVWRCLALSMSLDAPTATAAAPAAAQALTRELLDQQHRDGHWLVGCCLLAEAVAALADSELAARLEQSLRPYAGRFAVAGRVAAFRGSVSHALGLLAQASGDTSQAVADFEQAVAQHERMAARPFLERSLRALAGALESRGSNGDDERAAGARAHAAAAAIEDHAS
jgi:predicted ATPase